MTCFPKPHIALKTLLQQGRISKCYSKGQGKGFQTKTQSISQYFCLYGAPRT